MTPLHELRPERVALIKPSALGDIVHSLPVLTALRHRWPKAHITWIVNRSYEPLLMGHPHLDAILPFDRGALRRGAIPGTIAALRFARQLHTERFDLVIDLQGLLRTGIMAWLTRAARRVGFANAREGATKFYTDVVPVPDADRIHAIDRYRRVADAFGATGEPRFIVPIHDAAKTRADDWLTALPRPWLAVGVGARWVTKRWPPEQFAAAARAALLPTGGSAILIGGPEDAADAAKATATIGVPTLDLCGKTSLPELAAVLARVDAMLSNDTGPLHLAAALGRPCVAPYTCTKVALHGPYGPGHRGIAADIECHGSYRKTCDHLSCMTTLPAARLAGPLIEVLSGWPTRRTA